MTKAAGVGWKALARAAGFEVRGDSVEVRFHDGRTQRVDVTEDEQGALRVWTVACCRSDVEKIEAPELYAWLRNRLMDLVDFRVDREGRMLAEASVPTPGLTAAEWGLYVRTVARSADRLEYLLTGRDVE